LAKLFRYGDYPPLRGTLLSLDAREQLFLHARVHTAAARAQHDAGDSAASDDLPLAVLATERRPRSREHARR
jgi:hypothetical protein